MKKYATRAALKANAREALMGKYFTFAGAFLALWLLQYIITVPPAMMQLFPPVGIFLYYGANFVLQLFYAIFKVGLAFLFLSNACGQRVNMTGVFTGFGHTPGKTMAIQLFPSLLLLIPNFLPDYCLTQFLASREEQWLLSALIITLIFLPLSFYVKILYSQVFYIMLDFPDMSAVECLQHSRWLMKGSKLRYLWLSLSFLPLTLLGFATCGIGLFYVLPYQEQTYANFYLDLVANRAIEKAER